MSSDIKSIQPQRPPAAENTQRKSATAAPADNPAQAAPASSEIITVTEAAERRLNMEKALKTIEPTDPQRIAEIRAALANGTYQINADQIAKNLLSIEDELF